MRIAIPRTFGFLQIAPLAGLLFTSTTVWAQAINEDLKLLAADGVAFDEFGYSIAISNGIVVVGARLDDDWGPNSGSAYLFNANTGVQIAKLRANDGEIDDWFGASVAIDNGIVAVGCPLDNAPLYSGSAYLFDALTGAQLFHLQPSDGEEFDQFGWSIAIDNGIVAVGAYQDDDNGSGSGSAYLFNASTGALIRKLIPRDGAADDRFGYSIDISNGIVAVGAHLDDDNGGSSGSAYLFDAATGAQLFKLTASDGELSDEFGWSIGIDNGVVVVGAYQDNDFGAESGSAYLFDASTGFQTAKLLPNDGEITDWFGYSVAISNGVVAVGAPFKGEGGNHFGTAYLFEASSGLQTAKLLASDGGPVDKLGFSIAIDNHTIAASAYHDDDRGMWAGSAYIFQISCPADLNNDGQLDFLDISAFLAAYSAHDPLADLNNDGELDFLDISAFLASYSAGCP